MLAYGTSPVQRGPIEAELAEYGYNGRVLSLVIGLYGETLTDFSLILDLVARKLALKHITYFNVDFSDVKAMFRRKLARQWGHTTARARHSPP